MMIDFKENIELLERIIFNFVLTEDDNDTVIKPKNYDSLDKREIIPMIKANYFNDDTLQRLYRESKKFFLEYKKVPTKNELRELANLANLDLPEDKFNKVFAVDLTSYNYDFLFKYTKAFIFYKNLNESVIDVLSYLKTTDINPENVELITNEVRSKFNDKLNVSFTNAESGLDFFNPVDHVQLSKIGNPTGFKFFDKTLGGGWNPKTLVVFQGRPKVGKSMVLGNIAARSFQIGNTTGLVTVELSARSYMKRIGSNILNIRSDDYAGITDAAAAKLVQDKIIAMRDSGQLKGDLHLMEFSTGGATAIDIENHFLRLENRHNKKFRVIVVDYLNLMRPLKDQNGLYEKIKAISEELRGVAMRNEWCIISATQVKREDVGNFDLGMESVAESFGLIHTVDSLFGLMRSPLESRMKIKAIANRDNGYEESYKFYTMVKDYFRLSEESGMNSEFYSDDDEANKLEDQLRNEYSEIKSEDAISAKPVIEDEYDALFNSL